MEIKKEISLGAYATSARKQFSDAKNSLNNVQHGFYSRMNGRTMTGIIFSLIATLLWAGAYVYGIMYAVENLLLEKLFSADVEMWIMNIAAALILTLLLFVFTDNVISWVYYGQISTSRQKILRLQQRITDGENTIDKNAQAFAAAQKDGWNFPLKAGASIPKEAADISLAAQNVRALKNGFINTMKNILFFAATVIVSAAFCVAMAEHAQDLFFRWGGEDYDEAVKIVCYVVLGIVCIGEIILAKLVWSATDCEVTPLTLLILLVPPVAFVLLTAVAKFVIMGVVAIVGLAITLLGLAFGVACLCGFCGG